MSPEHHHPRSRQTAREQIAEIMAMNGDFSRMKLKEDNMMRNVPADGKDYSLISIRDLFRTANCLRVAELPIDMEEQFDYDNLSDNDFTKIVARAVALQYDWDIVLEYFMDRPVERNPRDLEADCQECIAACCLGMGIDLNAKDTMLMINNGTLFNLMFFDRYGNWNAPELAAVQRVMKASPKNRSRWVRQPETQMNRAKDRMSREIQLVNQGVRHVVGGCTFLDRGSCQCSIHDKPNYPNTCSTFPMGGEICERRFTTPDAEAAAVVFKVLNDAEPILAAMAQSYATQRPATRYAIPLTRQG